MALGPCEYMSCRSMLGSGFRARFRLGSHDGAVRGDREVLLCSEHEQLCRPIRDEGTTELILSVEGWVYPEIWMRSLG